MENECSIFGVFFDQNDSNVWLRLGFVLSGTTVENMFRREQIRDRSSRQNYQSSNKRWEEINM